MQSDLDWLISNLPADLQIPDDVRRYYCTEPGSIFMRNPRNAWGGTKKGGGLVVFIRRFLTPKVKKGLLFWECV